MSALIESIQGSENFFSLEPANKEAIAEAQERLGLLFAEEYIEYLEVFGVATFNNRELTGLCSSERLNVVEVTKKERLFSPSFPGDIYVVEELLIDRVVIAQDKDGQVYSYGPDSTKRFLASSLYQYYFPDKKNDL